VKCAGLRTHCPSSLGGKPELSWMKGDIDYNLVDRLFGDILAPGVRLSRNKLAVRERAAEEAVK